MADTATDIEMWTVADVDSVPNKDDQVERDNSKAAQSNGSAMEDTAGNSSLIPHENTLENHEPSSAIPQTTANDLRISTDYRDPDANVIANVTSVGDLREKVSVEWKDVNVFVPTPSASCCRRLCSRGDSDEPRIKQILFNVSGKIEAGSLLAVMGSSGAGKSTLMNVLAHRNIGAIQVTGAVEVNGHSIGLDINSLSAYIQQEDLFIGTLTVREHLTFQALLRMDRHTTKARREERVNEVLLELGLNKCEDTVIGIPGRLRGISGGEKKRLSFASEVLTNPPLLFADEPTSGLDAFMAQNLIASLQRLAASGHTIMCTIHQPSSEVYAMFDSILLVAEGRTAYMGSSAGALSYFERLGYHCPMNFNPADYFVHTLAIVPGDEEKCRERVKDICDAYSELQEQDAKKEEGYGRSDSFKDDDVYYKKRSPYKASWCRQLGAVLWRSWITNNRDALIFRIRVFQSIVTALIAGLIYLQTPYDTSGVQNIGGVLFFLTTSTSFSSLQGVVFTFPVELPVFLREHKNGMYRTDVYFLGKTIAELPIFLITPLLLTAISYWMIGLRNDFLHFLVCYGIIALLTVVSVSFGYIISTMAPTVTAATSLGPPLMLPLLIFGGFFLKASTIPVYFVWLKYISWFNYGFEALVINQWKDYGPIDCGIVTNMTNLQAGQGDAKFCIASGNAAIDFLGFNKDNMLFDIYCLVALLVGFRIIAFLFLLRRSYSKQ